MDEFGPFDDFDTPASIGQARLIRSPLEPWSNWFRDCLLARIEPMPASQFNDLGLVYDAAANGFGVALVRQQLGAAWLDSGRLVRLSRRSIASPFRHFICWKPGTVDRWECAAFAEWLIQALA